MKETTWGQLFDYVDKRCNFHRKIKNKPESVTWSCKGGNDKTFVKEFCDKHNLSFTTVSMFLEFTGGYCDCEVLFNSTNHFKRNDPIGKMRTFKWYVLNEHPPLTQKGVRNKEKNKS